jgi:bifunctional non-homologous end joining protein LigD
MPLPFRERRRLLDSLRLHGPHWQTSAIFDDGEALFAVAQERGLEGVVAKRLSVSYRPGERGWVKVKNRSYWRWEIEREGAIRARAHAAR